MFEPHDMVVSIAGIVDPLPVCDIVMVNVTSDTVSVAAVDVSAPLAVETIIRYRYPVFPVTSATVRVSLLDDPTSSYPPPSFTCHLYVNVPVPVAAP
jgi:hypothetical protein